ncbi:Uncharacterised protein [Vibrio cholerae]|nr:Uncharacterised protein [Vibrio cholerae]CSB15785.1 Uncharacterised protein [Vibrio cholerae]
MSRLRALFVLSEAAWVGYLCRLNVRCDVRLPRLLIEIA